MYIRNLWRQTMFTIIVVILLLKSCLSLDCKVDSTISRVDLSEPDYPSIFHDLTRKEIAGIQEYIYRQPDLRLVRPNRARVNSSYVFSMDLFLPSKTEVLRYFKEYHAGPRPIRSAIVTIFRGDEYPPVGMEYVVEPLPRPRRHIVKDIVPFEHRPITQAEIVGVIDMLNKECDRIIRPLLEQSFGGRTVNCVDRCLIFNFVSPMGPGVSKRPGERRMWLWMHQFVEYFALHPVDFAILVLTDGPIYVIEKVWYNNMLYDSLHALAMHSRQQDFPRIIVPFPLEDRNLFSKMQRRGHIFPSKPVTPPRQYEPEGKRYSVVAQEVKYMNWQFRFRLSSVHGPQLYDIRYLGKTIVYELSLQDLIVFYSGAEPAHIYANFFDSFVMIGQNIPGLVPGIDCPISATFIHRYLATEFSSEPVRVNNAFCVFEQNTEQPLRRHFSRYRVHGQFFEGTPGNVLVLRTIATITNYDYFFDFIFHQNGVMQVKVTPTGYILPSLFNKENDDKYGFRLNEKIVGNLHYHAFNFKVDIDINGVSNRYQTLDVVGNKIQHPFSSEPDAVWYQNKIRKTLKRTESEALLKFDFRKPKYHIFYNENVKSPEGNHRAYRIENKGMAPALRPEGVGNEPSAAWMRYQMIVTKRKENERFSSSKYAAFDSNKPNADIRKFYSDNENIVDQDLVAWVTMGTHHIPHSEDLPVTHTPGLDLSFFLMPFNYFPEDPGMGSRDSVRFEPKDDTNIQNGIFINKQTWPENAKCIPPRGNYFEYISRNPTFVFE